MKEYVNATSVLAPYSTIRRTIMGGRLDGRSGERNVMFDESCRAAREAVEERDVASKSGGTPDSGASALRVGLA